MWLVASCSPSPGRLTPCTRSPAAVSAERDAWPDPRELDPLLRDSRKVKHLARGASRPSSQPVVRGEVACIEEGRTRSSDPCVARERPDLGGGRETPLHLRAAGT